MSFQTVFFPVWMGAGKRTAVPDGARQLRAALKQAALDIPVAQNATLEPIAGIKARTELLEAFGAAQRELANLKGPIALLGGDCSSDFPLLSWSNQRFAPDLGVIWLDSHADLNTPETSPSAHFHGQVLRAALGESSSDVLGLLPVPLKPSQVFLAGTRFFDAAELEFVRAHHIPVLEVAALQADPSSLATIVRKAGFTRVHVHLDLDVLGAAWFQSTGFSTQGGVSPAELLAVIASLRAQFEIISFAVTEYAPQNTADLETVSGLVRALRGEA